MTRTAALLLLFAVAGPADAQFGFDEPAKKPPGSFAEIGEYRAEVVPNRARRGETVTFRLTVTPKGGAWTYPANPKVAQDAKNTIRLPPPGDAIFVGPVTDPPDAEAKAGKPDLHYPHAATWSLTAAVSRDAAPGKKTIRLGDGTTLLACNDRGCTSTLPKNVPAAELEVTDAEPVPYDPQIAGAVASALAGAKVKETPEPSGRVDPPRGAERKPDADARKAAKPSADYEADLRAGVRANLLPAGGPETGPGASGPGRQPLGGFLLTAALWGLISLVTPCVFPMIPITVSIFLHKSHGSTAEVLKQAAVYCLTIVVVLGVSAFTLLKFMGWLSTQPVTNLLLGGLFTALALSLFGMYELTLPNFMVRRLQAKQAQGGLVGTVFGALAFTVISFTCVAPFLGGFAGISAADAGGDLIAAPSLRDVLGGLAFSTAFAAPFFLLALFPRLLKQLPRSGSWLDSVKVVMGFLELAAALKFFRTAELRVFSPTQYFTYDLVLGGWVAIAFAGGLYLLNVFRLPHDEERAHVGVPRLLFALLFLGLSAYLLPSLFKGPDGKNQRPAGAAYAWVEAFLLPETEPFASDLKDALDRSRDDALKSGQPPRPVFVDFTGVTCTNCKYNEDSVFSKPAVRQALDRFAAVKLFTDEVPAALYAAAPPDAARNAEAVANRQFKIDAFGTDQLPLYAVLQPQVTGKVKVLGVYPEGKINEPDRFVAFLTAAWEASRK